MKCKYKEVRIRYIQHERVLMVLLQEWSLTRDNKVKHRDLCLTLLDKSAAGQIVKLEGCRKDPAQVQLVVIL